MLAVGTFVAALSAWTLVAMERTEAMSARDEFPWPVNDPQHAIKQHGIMCREIDKLRMELASVARRADAFVGASTQPESTETP